MRHFPAHKNSLATRIGERSMQRQTKQTEARRRAPLQIELFTGEPREAIGDMLVWSGLPTETQAALTSLIAQLLLEHVMITDKVRPHHLERKALLYVRQSSAHQVLHNRESSALAMRDRLIAL